MIDFLLYLDPGSGSYLLQMIIAAILGALFYIKGIWWRIKSFFMPRKNKKENKASGEDE
ncbi:MAG TPA: hypothetical protein VIK74_09930 [Parasegetibacter sp.]|jgi:hypothetical protein